MKTLKLYAGPIDGTRNAAYVQALQRFQRAHRLPATGRLSAETRSALGIS
ncbi:MAG: peptidoglycan-binding domain-containing protein [Hyphomonadaceae bacterium]